LFPLQADDAILRIISEKITNYFSVHYPILLNTCLRQDIYRLHSG
jgi:hypothetical protein